MLTALRCATTHLKAAHLHQPAVAARRPPVSFTNLTYQSRGMHINLIYQSRGMYINLNLCMLFHNSQRRVWDAHRRRELWLGAGG